MNKKEKKEKGGNSGIIEVIKALIISIVVTLALILVFALIVKWCGVNENVIAPVNQAIKAVSLLVGCIIAFRSSSGGWRKGIIVGILYVAVSFLMFSLMDKQFIFSVSLLFDLLLGMVMGLICGVIAVNVRRPKITQENA